MTRGGSRRSFLTPDLWHLLVFQLLDAASMLPRVIATGWLVLEVTDAPFWVGAVFGIEGLVMLSCGGLGGVVAARVERRRTLAAVQAMFTIVLVAVAVMSGLEMLRLWHLLAAAVLTGAGRCLHIPLSTGLLQRAAGQGQLMRALGARALTFNIGKMVGSALVGITISVLGFAAAFLLLAVIRVGAAAVLTGLSRELGRRARVTGAQPVFLDLIRQFRYTMRVTRVRSVFVMSMLMELCVFSSSSMMPVIARDVLGVGASDFRHADRSRGAGCHPVRNSDDDVGRAASQGISHHAGVHAVRAGADQLRAVSLVPVIGRDCSSAGCRDDGLRRDALYAGAGDSAVGATRSVDRAAGADLRPKSHRVDAGWRARAGGRYARSPARSRRHRCCLCAGLPGSQATPLGSAWSAKSWLIVLGTNSVNQNP